METGKIISYLQQSDKIGGNEMVEISALKKNYPWFSTLYQLEAKCLKNENKFGLKKAIKTASLYAGDREVLYDFMHDALTVVAPSTKVTVVAKPTQKETTELKADVSDNKTTSIEKEESRTKEIVKEKKEEVKQPEIKPEVKKSTVDKPVEITHKKQKTKVEKPVEHKVVYDPLVELQDKIVKLEEPVAPTKVYDPLVELPKLEKKKPKKKNDKQDFFSWLDSLEDEQPEEEPKPRKLKMSAEASALLENFIKNRPSISRIRTDVDRTEVHKVSNQNRDNELVTESLAQLHLKQGRPENAIEIYEKLRLQNPQKFSYFAALIEKIKQDKNIE